MNILQGEISDDVSHNLTTQIIELCITASTIDSLQIPAKEILKILTPKQPLFKIKDNVLIMINEYTFYKTVVEDIRYYRHNINGQSITEIEYEVMNNSYDCPMKVWISQEKTFKA